MTNELKTLNEKIAEKVGENLVDLIPQDQWQAIVDKEVQIFKNQTAPRIIQDLLKEAYLERAKGVISELADTTEWDEITGEYTNKALEQFIGQSAGVIVGTMLTPAMQQVLQDLRYKLGY